MEAASTQAAGVAAGASERGSRLAHYGGLVAYLAEVRRNPWRLMALVLRILAPTLPPTHPFVRQRLQGLSQTLQGLQAQRRKLSGMAPGGGGGKGGATGLAAAAAARSRKR